MFMAAMAIAIRWSWIVFFEASAAVSTLVLVIGAAIEYKPMLEPIAALFKKKLAGKITEYERCALRKLGRHTVGPILVVLGIAGELIFGLGAFITQEIESIADESKIAQLQNDNLKLQGQVGDTAEKLRLANDRFNAIEIRAAALDKQLDTTGRTIDAMSNKVAATTDAQAELESRVAWRTVSDSQKNKLREYLQAVKGRSVTLEWETHDPEQNAFAPQLRDALRFSGLTVKENPMQQLGFGGESPDEGIRIEGNDRAFSVALAKALVCSSLVNPPVAGAPSRNADEYTIYIRPKGRPVDKKAAGSEGCKTSAKP